ncbi:DUF2313 domain-containing protein [Neisseriaceae bacterium TC5R-5]|nr:DUF2313 domain-containing protein [Neisseriaceae bacterium TC5R-5]
MSQLTSHQELLTRLLPPISYRRDGELPQAEPSLLQAELASEGAALDRVQLSAEKLVGATTPFLAESLLPDWERVCGLTPPLAATYQERQQAVLAKLMETGGLSIPYFTQLARRMGYTVQINEPQPFRAGVNRAGQQLWVADIPFVWQVLVIGSQTQVYQFRAGQSMAGERLTSFGEPKLEQVFQDLKPAHTFVYFAYQNPSPVVKSVAPNG